MSQPLLVSANQAQEAVEAVLPSVRYAIARRIAVGSGAHIVVGNPAFARRDDLTVEAWIAEGGILYELTLGETAIRGLPLRDIVRIKAFMAWRDEMDTRQMLSFRPDLICPGDIRHAGGVVENNWAVGVGGFQALLDEAFARMILAMGWALVHRDGAVLAPKGHFFQEKPVSAQ
jgi:hypothetical protein